MRLGERGLRRRQWRAMDMVRGKHVTPKLARRLFVVLAAIRRKIA